MRPCGRGSWTEQLQWRAGRAPGSGQCVGPPGAGRAGVRARCKEGADLGIGPQGKAGRGREVEPCEHSTTTGAWGSAGRREPLAHHQGPRVLIHVHGAFSQNSVCGSWLGRLLRAGVHGVRPWKQDRRLDEKTAAQRWGPFVALSSWNAGYTDHCT